MERKIPLLCKENLPGKICVNNTAFIYMFFFKMPTKVERDIKKIQRQFLLDWCNEGRKIVRVKWNNICKPKEEG